MGLQYKIIDKMFFCMSRNSRIGAFFSIEGALQVIGLVSLALTVTLLIKIGFPLQAVLLLLLSVRIGIRMIEDYLSIIPYLIYSVHWCRNILPTNQGSQGVRSRDRTKKMGNELGTFVRGSNNSTSNFARVFLLLEDRKHQTRGIVFDIFNRIKLSLVQRL